MLKKPPKKRKYAELSTRERLDSFKNCLVAFPVPKNPMIAAEILALSAIGKKLRGQSMASGGHLGFWALAAFQTNLRVGGGLIIK